MTDLQKVYDLFLEQVTDDMYMEITKEETTDMLFSLFKNALPWFEFPRFSLFDFDEDLQIHHADLTLEEMRIIAIYMAVEWMGQQLATIELIRLKYSGSDFKFTSQANHMHKLMKLKEEYTRNGFHLQRLYKRRKADKNGIMKSTFGSIMSSN